MRTSHVSSVSHTTSSGGPLLAVEPLEGRRLLANVYVTPAGAGTKSGVDWANAAGGSEATIEAKWAAMSAGGTLFLGSETYGPNMRLNLDTGGTSPTAMKTLKGVDTGGGLPLLSSYWTLGSTNKYQAITIGSSVSHIRVEDLRISNYYIGIQSGSTGTNFRFKNVTLSAVKEGISLDGGANGSTSTSAYMDDVLIDQVTITGFEKRGVRIQDGIRNITIQNSTADAGGSAWEGENFHIGFQLEAVSATSARCQNVRFINCTAKRAYDALNLSNGYWNGDGFAIENGNTGVSLEQCKAFDNTDAGFDIKSNTDGTTLSDCIAIGNKRNFRIWSTGIALTNSLGVWGWDFGGAGTQGANGLWVGSGANVALSRCTFVNNGTNVYFETSSPTTPQATLSDSILALGTGVPSGVQFNQADQISLVNSVQYKAGSGPNSDPQFNNAWDSALYGNGSTDWNGVGNNFDSITYPTKGYRSVSSTSTPLSRTGWTASASRGSGAVNTLDGNASTLWNSGAFQAVGQYFQLNLGSAQSFSRLVMDSSGAPTDYARGFQVFVSSDGTNWDSAIATGTGTGPVVDISFAAQTKQYVRIVLNTASSSVYWKIGEINLYA